MLSVTLKAKEIQTGQVKKNMWGNNSKICAAPNRGALHAPFYLPSLATIPVQKAEALIGKTRLDPYCDLTRGPETYEIAFNFKGARR